MTDFVKKVVLLSKQTSQFSICKISKQFRLFKKLNEKLQSGRHSSRL